MVAGGVVEEEHGLDDGAGGESAEGAGVLDADVVLGELPEQVVGEADGRVEQGTVAEDAVGLQQPPQRVLAAPHIPVPVARPAHHSARRLQVGRREHPQRVAVGAQIAVRLLQRDEPQRLAAQTLLQRLVAAVLGVAAGADDQLAPELPLPEADHPARVVQLPLKRLRRLTVHHVPRRLGLHPLIRKPSQRLTRQTQQTDVTQRRYVKAVLDAHGRFPPFCSIESVSPDGRGTDGSSPDGSLF